MLHLLRGQGPLQIVADDKAGPVAVGEDDEPPFFRDPPQQLQTLPVVEDPKAPGFQDHGVDELLQGVLVIAALHDNGLLDLQHGAPPADNSRTRESIRSWLSAPDTDFMARSVSAQRAMAQRHQGRS